MNLDDLIYKLVDPEAVFLEPRHVFDEAIIGATESVSGVRVVVYDSAKCLLRLMSANHWNQDEATDWFEYNIRAAFAGPGTPMFLDLI